MGIRKGETALIIHDSYAQQVSDITRDALQLEGVKVEMYCLPVSGRPLRKSRMTWAGSLRRYGRTCFSISSRASAKRLRSASRSSTWNKGPAAGSGIRPTSPWP